MGRSGSCAQPAVDKTLGSKNRHLLGTQTAFPLRRRQPAAAERLAAARAALKIVTAVVSYSHPAMIAYRLGRLPRARHSRRVSHRWQ